MLSINAKEINTYLKLINDQNPIHAHIVPGQMIVQMALQSQRLQWTSYRVKYIETVGINELIQFQMVSESIVVILNKHDETLIKIIKV
ncbi:hypothetical protein [Staphylococcus saprophyticus]|uniref:hypothetical protein n=1 Tax=Staphylococcus saprophyticus TaxID=29385 RepID=UPI001401CC8C|nr:hypothetical protein [Staphylococcus saprophyticus]